MRLIMEKDSERQTYVTIKDGIMWRCEDNNNMLRKPRSSLLHDKSDNRDTEKINKVRFGLAIKKQKATQLVQALTQAVKNKNTDTAADLCLAASKDTTNEFNETKQNLFKQYHTFHGRYLDKMDVPRIPAQRTSQNQQADSWVAHSEAARQIKSAPSLAHSQEYYRSATPRQSSARAVRTLTFLPATRIREHSPSVQVVTDRPGYYNTIRSQSATTHPTQLTEDQLEEPVSQSEIIKNRVKSASYCQTPRTQLQGETTQLTSSYKQDDCNDENSRPVVRINSSPLLRGRIKYRSPWLSPLQMSNIPADAKLRYINNAEKQRFKEVMSYTSKLLNSKYMNAATAGGQPLRKHLMYQPKLEPNTKTVSIRDEHTQQIPLTKTEKMDMLADEVYEHRTHSAVARLQSSSPSRCRSPERPISSSIDPLRLGSVTSRALITSFCLLTPSS